MSKEKQGQQLRDEAIKLGVSLEGSYDTSHRFREGAIQARVREAKRAKREKSLWLIALISALASLASAIASWISAASN